MARTAISDPEMMKEQHDSPEDLESKVDRLAALVRGSKHLVAFTGAGISTSAGIPDFRGPNGKWTREAQGNAPLAGVTPVRAFPTPTHMALVELHRRGTLKYLISQNCDGLHRRSGLPASAISELHGNGNVEICEDCDQRYFRDFKCDRMAKRFDHFTGRFCRCGGRLLNSTIDFGQSLDPVPLELAERHSQAADLHIALGSSLTVSPACDMPRTTGEKPDGNLVICNLQRTPLTQGALFQVYAETDTVMRMLMERLEVPIPEWHLLRRIVVSTSADSAAVSLKAVDVHDPSLEIGILRDVDWDGTASRSRSKGRDEDAENVVAARFGAHSRPTAGLDLAALCPELHFVGNYREPSFRLEVGDGLMNASAVDMALSYNPYQCTWSCLRCELLLGGAPVAAAAPATARQSRYGHDHREYCVQGVMNQYKRTRQEAERTVDERAREARSQAVAFLGPAPGPLGKAKAAAADPAAKAKPCGRAPDKARPARPASPAFQTAAAECLRPSVRESATQQAGQPASRKDSRPHVRTTNIAQIC